MRYHIYNVNHGYRGKSYCGVNSGYRETYTHCIVKAVEIQRSLEDFNSIGAMWVIRDTVSGADYI
jgi:hypothetical protein